MYIHRRVPRSQAWPYDESTAAGRTNRQLVQSGDPDRRTLIERVAAGGFPEAVQRSPARRGAWMDAYVTTVMQSVIRDMAAIERIAEIPRLLRLCAACTAGELNVSRLASDFGVPTVVLHANPDFSTA
jgi:hypothetical protein